VLATGIVHPRAPEVMNVTPRVCYNLAPTGRSYEKRHGPWTRRHPLCAAVRRWRGCRGGVGGDGAASAVLLMAMIESVQRTSVLKPRDKARRATVMRLERRSGRSVYGI
jgi:hypothetical protein